jgi:hypothetical protein
MPNVDKAVCSCLLAYLALVAVGCNSAHTPGSTETGNPPVIDIGKVALVVSSDEVHIVGKPGAVTPGGADVTIQVVGSDMVVTTESAPDGSFELKVSGGPDAVIEVKASSGEDESETVYVTRGSASVSTGGGGKLSCQDRDRLAGQVVSNALSTADASCETAADCKTVSTDTMCRDTCGSFYIGKLAVAPIEAAVSTVNSSFCLGFEADGCMRTIPPCTPPIGGPVACVNGSCTQQPPTRPECPPNGRYVEDVCDSCGMTGGCITTGRCAVLCSDSSACSVAGTSCSMRGICEVTRCD